MDWSNIRRLLADNLLPLMKAPERGQAWLESLGESDAGRLLGVCIAIDFVGGATAAELFAEMLDLVDLPVADACRAFANARNRHPRAADLVCASRFDAPKLPSDDAYARILGLDAYITYYESPSRPGITLAPEHQSRVRRRLAKHPICHSEGYSLAHIDRWWTGSTPSVWVTSFNDIHEMDAETPKDNLASAILDGLGIFADAGADILAVKYPPHFGERCVQPTSLDPDWSRGRTWYISYYERDGWGRTHSLSGSATSSRERVHRHFKGLTSEYRAFHVGKASDVSSDGASLLAEADSRLTALLARPPSQHAARTSKAYGN